MSFSTNLLIRCHYYLKMKEDSKSGGSVKEFATIFKGKFPNSRVEDSGYLTYINLTPRVKNES